MKTTQFLQSNSLKQNPSHIIEPPNVVLLILLSSLYFQLVTCMLSTYHILLGHSISQTRLIPASFARYSTASSLVMQNNPPNPPGRGSRRGHGRGRGRSFFRRGASTAARTRTAPAAPLPPVPGPSEPINGPGLIPSSTQNTTLSNIRFADFVARGRLSVDLLEKLSPFDRCTEVQAATFDTILDGNDV